MFSARSLVSGFIAGLLISSAPLSSYAAPSVFPARNPSYQTGNAPLDGLLAEYEKSIRAKGDSPRISAFVRESSGFKNRKISEGLRDEILKNRIESVSKNVLSQRLPANIASESVKKAVLGDLKGSFKKRNSADFRVFVRTSLSRADLEAALSAFGNAEMTFSFRAEDGKDVYEIAFPASGRYAKTLGVKLEKGEI
ncbi:MAG: hypothetical protein QG650_428, partial [Patescibacteria group bacterium]|nr:hypothetical protein [Patescibacteria group bacterium]